MIRNAIFTIAALGIIALGMTQCSSNKNMEEKQNEKVVVYQVFTRLFGNTNATNKKWGAIEENGVGKFNDIDEVALEAIRDLGVSHIWYTGVLHHCVIRDYTKYGISNDDPDVVKGRAGSPYAVKDYYNVNPDLAEDPAKRMEEFEALIQRSHENGLKVIIDIVPNHIARNYQSLSNPEGEEDFGASDDQKVEYKRDNNFYYIPHRKFEVPQMERGFEPLGGESHPLSDGQFEEFPAKWTGNGARTPHPTLHDWFETVKVNYGVAPNGNKDFDALPEGFENESYETHYNFWSDKDVPDSWKKFTNIALYWLDKGVDGFRYDMAEMVPVEFWSYMNSAIKMKNPDAFLLAEIYTPSIYRDYIYKGKMDYLYDKVDLYDTLKHIMQGHGSTDNLVAILEGQNDIEHHMLHFLENHDEHRLASPEFAGDARKGMPAMVVSSAVSSAPVMVYFGQEVGEKGAGDAGFGNPWRTTIFDYWGVSSHQRWMNEGAFDGGQLSGKERDLREFYQTVLNFKLSSEALSGDYAEIHSYNRENTENYNHRLFSFLRWKEKDRVLVITNFDSNEPYNFDLKIPSDLFESLRMKMGRYRMKDELGSEKEFEMQVTDSSAVVSVGIEPLESFILSF
jgi:glycosidase